MNMEAWSNEWRRRLQEAKRIERLATIIESVERIEYAIDYACTTPEGEPRKPELTGSRVDTINDALLRISEAVDHLYDGR